MSPGTIIGLYVAGGFVLLAVIKVMCYFTLAENFQAQQFEVKEPASILFKCLVLYSQWLLLVASLNIEWPPAVAYPFRMLAWFWAPSNPETLSIDCLLTDSTTVPLAVQRVLFYVSVPVLLLAVLLLLELLLSKLKHKPSAAAAATLKDRLGSSAMVVMFFFLPGMLRIVFGLFACVPLDRPAAAPHTAAAVGSFWVYNISTVCFAGWHRALFLGLGLPLLLLLCIGLPAAVVYITVSNRSCLDDRLFQQHWGFLTRAYRASRCWWEAVVICQTMALVAVSAFGANMGALIQAVVMTAVLAVFLYVLMVLKPYAYAHTGQAMLRGVQCLLLTSFVGHTFQLTSSDSMRYGATSESKQAAAYGLVMGILLLLINLAYVCSVLRQLLKLLNWQAVRVVLAKCSKVVQAWLSLLPRCAAQWKSVK